MVRVIPCPIKGWVLLPPAKRFHRPFSPVYTGSLPRSAT